MAGFKYDTTGKLREIFSGHCNLSIEQYEWISGEFGSLVEDIRDAAPQAEIEGRMGKLATVFDFLMETECLTLKEHYDLNELIGDIWDSRVKGIGKAALESGVLL